MPYAFDGDGLRLLPRERGLTTDQVAGASASRNRRSPTGYAGGRCRGCPPAGVVRPPRHQPRRPVRPGCCARSGGVVTEHEIVVAGQGSARPRRAGRRPADDRQPDDPRRSGRDRGEGPHARRRPEGRHPDRHRRLRRDQTNGSPWAIVDRRCQSPGPRSGATMRDRYAECGAAIRAAYDAATRWGCTPLAAASARCGRRPHGELLAPDRPGHHRRGRGPGLRQRHAERLGANKVGLALRHLSQLAIIVYEPQRGPGAFALIGLPNDIPAEDVFAAANDIPAEDVSRGACAPKDIPVRVERHPSLVWVDDTPVVSQREVEREVERGEHSRTPARRGVVSTSARSCPRSTLRCGRRRVRPRPRAAAQRAREAQRQAQGTPRTSAPTRPRSTAAALPTGSATRVPPTPSARSSATGP